MGARLLVKIDRELRDVDVLMDGKVLAKNMSRLSDVANDLEIDLLDDYVSASPNDLAEFANEIALSLDEEPSHTPKEYPPEEWFAPRDALVSLRELKTYVDEHPDAFFYTSELVFDLDRAIEVLNEAEKANAQFHFEVDI